VIALETPALLYAAVALVAVAGVGAQAMDGTSSPLERAAAAFTILLYNSITNLVALRIGKADRPFPPWIAALGLISCLALVVTLSPTIIASGLGLLVVGFVFRWLYRNYMRNT
jgi:hypothetical protein